MPVPQQRTQPRNKRTKEPQRTAQPKPITDEARSAPLPEPGLAVDPDQLGAKFLRDATEQDNMESWRGDGVAALDPLEGPPSDEPLTGPSYDPDEGVWDATADLTLQSGPLGADSEALDEQPMEPSEAEEPVQLAEDVIDEGTLLDREGSELGQVVTAQPATEDTRKHRYLRRQRPPR
jgi:hypothetical protein